MEESQQTVICPNCGAATDRQARFCGMCGSSTMTLGTDPHVGETVAGRYSIKRKIAAGGMGTIYVAEHETLSQQVAVKLLHRRFASDERVVQRFFNEARSYCRVKHPHAVTLLDFGRLNDGTLYIVTEFIEGLSLRDFVVQHAALSPSMTVRVATHVAEALAAAHAEQIVHRDLKPDNVMVTAGPGERYTAKVLDFGIAKIIDDGEARLTQTGTVFGTPEFMSPEQARGEHVGFPSDVYGFGCLIFFMLTGRAPFEGRNRQELIKKHIGEPPPLELLLRREDASPDLVSLVQDCLRKAPTDRPADFLAVLGRLEKIAAGLPAVPDVGPATEVDNSDTEPQVPAASPTRQSVQPPGGGAPTRPDRTGPAEAISRAVAESKEEADVPHDQGLSLGPGPTDEPELGGLVGDDAELDMGLGLALDHADDEDGFSWGGDEPDDLMGQPLDLGDSDAAPSYLEPRRWGVGVILVPLVILAAIAAGYLYFEVFPSGDRSEPASDGTGDHASAATSDGETAPTTSDAPDTTPDEPPEPARVVMAAPLPREPSALVDGATRAAQTQVLLRGGAVDEALASWGAATAALEGAGQQTEDFPVATRLARAQELIGQADAALRRDRCRQADNAVAAMREISPELRRRYLRPLNECNRRVRNQGLPPRTLE